MSDYTYASEVIKTMLSATLSGIKGGIEAAGRGAHGAALGKGKEA